MVSTNEPRDLARFHERKELVSLEEHLDCEHHQLGIEY